MPKWLRKMRGVLGSGVLWGGMWAVVGASLGMLFGFGAHGVDWQVVVSTAAELGTIGGIAGASFGGLLASTQGRRSLRDVSLFGVAAVGLVGGFLAPIALAVLGMMPGRLVIPLGVASAVLGAVTSTATVALAKRAEGTKVLPDSRESLLTPGSRMD